MIARAGRLLYWIACIFAAFFLVLGAVVAFTDAPSARAITDNYTVATLFVLIGGLVWAFGHIIRLDFQSEANSTPAISQDRRPRRWRS